MAWKFHPIWTESMNTPSVEFRIPISATDHYFRILKYLVESVKEFGGEIASKAKFVVSVSRDTPYQDIYQNHQWVIEHAIEFRWVDEESFLALKYIATAIDRYYVESTCDVVIMCDVDIFVAGDLDSIIKKTHVDQKQLGFIALSSPFNEGKHERAITGEDLWIEIFKSASLPAPTLNCSYNWNKTDNERCPYYFNYGFVILPRKFADDAAETFEREISEVDKVLKSRFRGQIANTLCNSRHNIPCSLLSVNYNYPLNKPEDKLRELNPVNDEGELPTDVKVFHYLGKGDIDKEDFKTEASLDKFLSRRDLAGSIKVFQQKLKVVTLNIQHSF